MLKIALMVFINICYNVQLTFFCHLALMQILAPVLMVMSSWLEGPIHMRDVWRSVSTIHGGQYVMTAGTAGTHWLPADNLATPSLVDMTRLHQT